MLLNSSAAMCSELPLPLEANEALSGFALIQAISSPTLFAGTDGCTASTSGTTWVNATGSKSATGSYGICLNRNLLVAWLEATITTL